jgi:hypothetical protein
VTPGDFPPYTANMSSIQAHQSSQSWFVHKCFTLFFCNSISDAQDTIFSMCYRLPHSNPDGFEDVEAVNPTFDLSDLYLSIVLSHKPRFGSISRRLPYLAKKFSIFLFYSAVPCPEPLKLSQRDLNFELINLPVRISSSLCRVAFLVNGTLSNFD